jgi:alpha-1,3-rhamnosyl/mannosyltransferase
MRILFNRLTTLGNRTGIGRHAANLLTALEEVAVDDRIEGFPTGLPWTACRAHSEVAALVGRLRRHAHLSQPFSWLRPLVRLPAAIAARLDPWVKAWIRNHIRSLLAHGEFDGYHEPNFLPFATELPTIVTIHDLSVLYYPEWHPVGRIEQYRRRFLRGLAQSRHLITVSDTVRREVIRALGVPPERVTRVYNGVSADFEPLPKATTAAWLRRLRLQPGYLLHVGTLEPRKNLLMLMRAYCGLPLPLRERAPLLLAGGWGWQDQGIRDYYHGIARHRGVRHLGYLPEGALPALYNGARALVCPSHYEGFGLPCIEMLACGGAVLASTAEVFRETLAGQAQLIPADDVDAWRTAMSEMIADEDCRLVLRRGARKHARRFNWKDAALETLKVYRIACGASPKVAGQARKAA